MPYTNSRKKKIIMIMLVILALSLIVCFCVSLKYENSDAYQTKTGDVDTTAIDLSYLDVTELDQETQMIEPVNISLTDGTVEITEGGDYYLTGKMTGVVHINAQEQNVHLFFDGIEIESKSGPALYCENAGKLVITLVEGSDNTVSDSGDYRDYVEPDSCIYSNCSMTLNGSGNLNVNGFYKDAIRSKDVVKILGGNYTIKCKRSGFRGNDGIVVNDGSFAISSEKNAFKTTNRGAQGRGCLIIGGGYIRIVAGEYSFVTQKADLYMFNCIVNSRSVIDTFDVAGQLNVIEGCIQ